MKRPVLHPDRVREALEWFEIERGSFDTEDIADVADEYETAIAALKAMEKFQKTCRLTPGTVDTAVAIRGFFDSLRDLTQHLSG